MTVDSSPETMGHGRKGNEILEVVKGKKKSHLQNYRVKILKNKGERK